MIDIEVNNLEETEAWLRAVAKESPKALHEGAKNFMITVFQLSQKAVPVDTGVLRESGHLDIGDKEISITYSAPYAAAVHWGYVRHYIKPVRRKALRWEVGRKERLSAHRPRKNAQWAFSRGHYVPKDRARTKPQPFLTVPFKRAIETDLLKREVLRALFKERKA